MDDKVFSELMEIMQDLSFEIDCYFACSESFSVVARYHLNEALFFAEKFVSLSKEVLK